MSRTQDIEAVAGVNASPQAEEASAGEREPTSGGQPLRTHEKGRSPLNENGLTPKQQLFVEHYLVSLNATDAARQAGYTGSDIVIRSTACENLTKPNIIDFLKKRLQVVSDKLETDAVDVHQEFREQLAFAKRLRIQANEYLSDPVDPMRMNFIPRANEIEIVYLDHNDMEEISFGNKVIERPKKKKAMLDIIMASLVEKGLEPEKFSIKRTDMLKFALDAINTADVCIDKFARMGGAYQKSRPNEVDPAELIEALTDRLMSKGWEREAAKKFAQSKYGNGQPLQLGP